jgi:hypothetical protein
VRLVREREGRLGRLALLLVPPAALLGGALALLLRATTLRDYLFYTFRFNSTLMRWFRFSPIVERWFHEKPAFFYCSVPFRGPWPWVGYGVVLLALAAPRARAAWRGRDARILAVALALLPLSFLELRRVYGAYPNLWPQHYLMWSFVVALVYGCAAAGAAALFEGYLGGRRLGERVGGAVALALAVAGCVLFVRATRTRLTPPKADKYWNGISYLQRTLAPDEIVWIQPDAHPIGAFDASYYWYSFSDLVPAALAYSADHAQEGFLPALTDETLPMCRIEQGLEPRVRFVHGNHHLDGLWHSLSCFLRMRQSGRLVPTPMNDVWEVRDP